MRPLGLLGLVVFTLLVTAVCFTGSATAQPAPAQAAAPEAEPPAPAPEVPSAAERAPAAASPAPVASQAPAAPAASPAPAAPLVSSPFGPPSQLEPAPAMQARPRPVQGRRLDESTAAVLSIAGTVGSWVLFRLSLESQSGNGALLGLAGMIVGPNLGHWYQGVPVTRGTGLRVIATVATLYGFVRVVMSEGSSRDTDGLYIVGGALLYLGATFDDIINAPLRARKHNQRLEILGVTPMVTGRSAGLALGGRF